LLTAEGEAYYQRCLRILADMDEAELEAAAGSAEPGRRGGWSLSC
jgi:DNA-binding transcriptional LysR family regulator